MFRGRLKAGSTLVPSEVVRMWLDDLGGGLATGQLVSPWAPWEACEVR
jgi:hypothetical protein